MNEQKTIQLNVINFDKMRAALPAEYNIIRFDSNNDCNVHCVYCHNERSSELIELESFRFFLKEKVLSVRQFQVGCVMEPTLDKRLCDFMEAVAASPAPPRHGIRLQTNGILLHRHEASRMVKAGLNLVTLSLDSVTGHTHKDLRGGTSLSKVARNIVEFRHACPDVSVCLITTVTAANIDEVDELVSWGLSEGVAGFRLRQMFHDFQSQVVDHEKMRRLEVTATAFAAMRARIEASFAGKADFTFLGEDYLMQERSNILQRSLIAPQSDSNPSPASEVLGQS